MNKYENISISTALNEAIAESSKLNEDLLSDNKDVIFKKDCFYGYDTDMDYLTEEELNRIFLRNNDELIIPKGTKAKILKLAGPGGGWPLLEIDGVELDFGLEPEELLEFVTYEELEKAQAAFQKAISENYVSELVYVCDNLD